MDHGDRAAMMAYFDTSAAMKLLVKEAGTAELQARLRGSDDVLIGSWLLHTELHCAASRNPVHVPVDQVELVLRGVTLLDLSRADLHRAATLGGGLRSHDAIHLAVALRSGCDTMITYDRELADASRAMGLDVTQPA